MARDLAQRETPRRSQQRITFNRETTMPRQSTDRPEKGVFATIRRPDTSDADYLSKVLGLANDLGQKINSDIKETHDNRDAADALLDFQNDDKDDKRFAKSRAYRDAWQREGAKNLALTISQEATEAATEVLNDPNATPEDVNAAIEGVFRKHTEDERGQPLDFGTVEAKTILGKALGETHASLMASTHKVITEHQNSRLAETMLSNMLAERTRGAPIGEDPKPDPYYSAQAFKPVPKGWQGSEADAIFELGMTQPEAKQFIATGKDPRTTPKDTSTVLLGKPTGRLPVRGATRANITNTMAQHEARGSEGVDIDGKIGDEIEAPAGGKVTIGFNKPSGNFVKIDHGNGVVSTYSHLSKVTVKDGSVVKPGEVFALVGNTGHVSSKTGDGSHLHWRVKVNGKDVDPLAYHFSNGGTELAVTTGDEPELASALPEQEASSRPGFDVEGFMQKLPPSVDKGWAKGWLVQALVAEAASSGDASILNGLEDSVRKDGTPSFTPDERLKLATTRETLRERARSRAERATNELQQKNADLVLDAYNNDTPPSDSWLAEQGSQGLLDPRFVHAMISSNEAERRQQAREAKADAKEAERDAEADIDAFVYGEEVARRSGILDHASYAEDLKRFENGEFGSGKKAAARLKRLQAAARAGRAETEKNPAFAQYSAQLKAKFKPKKQGDGSYVRRGGSTSPVDEGTFAAMMAHYEQKVHSGMAPEEAYRSAIAAYGPKNSPDVASARKARLATLRAKR